CGASLALMDAGAPISSTVAGIAMGLVLEGKDYAVLIFFQAEDGIRGLIVTGVQTCALPICPNIAHCGKPRAASSSLPLIRMRQRSEERRVGKECRPRGAQRPSQKRLPQVRRRPQERMRSRRNAPYPRIGSVHTLPNPGNIDR